MVVLNNGFLCRPWGSLRGMTLATSTRGLGGCGKRECTVIYRYGAIDKDLFSNVPQEGCLWSLIDIHVCCLHSKMRGTYNIGDYRQHKLTKKPLICSFGEVGWGDGREAREDHRQWVWRWMTNLGLRIPNLSFKGGAWGLLLEGKGRWTGELAKEVLWALTGREWGFS